MGKKILLADDSITIQKVIELTFSDEDFEVLTVGNGRLAVEKVQEARPDLVLCDIIMPEKDGYEVCDFIKRNPALSHIPVLLLTGAFEPFDQERAARVGCDGFLAKPFEPQTLIAKVKDLLSRAPAPRPAAPAPPPPGATRPPTFLTPPPAPATSASTQMYERPVFDEPTFEPEPVSSLDAFVRSGPAPRPTAPAPSFEPEFEVIEPLPGPSSSASAAPVEGRREVVESAFFEPEPLPEAPPISDLAALDALPFDPEPLEPAPPLLEPEPLAVAPPPLPIVAASELEPEVYFVPEEPFPAEPQPTTAPPPEDELMPAGSPALLDQYSVHSLDEAVAAVEEAAEPASDFYRAVDASEPELVPMTAEEAASLSEVPVASAVPAAGEVSAWRPPVPPPVSWSQPTVEVPLEERARASVRSAQEPEAVFEEVFDEEAPATRGVAPLFEPIFPPLEEPVAPRVAPTRPLEAAAVPPIEPGRASEAAAVPAIEPGRAFEAAAVPAIEPGRAFEAAAEESFEDVLREPESEPLTAPVASVAAELAVPVDMVAQIAQRVVAQISEQVIREIAWEVIPDLAEALIKKEIERLKAELQEP